MNNAQKSLVPNRRVRDPRHLLYHYPDMTAQRYAKLMQTYHNDQLLRQAEQLAKGTGYLLVPFCCLSWRIRKKTPQERRLQIGVNVYYFVHPTEMSRTAMDKYREYLDSIEEDEAS